jgi:DNA repair protein RadC
MTREKFYKMLVSGEFANMVRETTRGEQLTSSAAALNILRPYLAATPDREQFVAVFLDAKNHILSIETLFTGTITASAVYPREVIKRVLSLGAAAVIFAHNHPSGNPEPSSHDHGITRKLIAALAPIDVTVHDHMVITTTRYHSMADLGEISRHYDEIKRIF